MASLTRHPRSNYWSIKFRFGGKQFCKSLHTEKEKEAQRLRGIIERTLDEMERGRLVRPPDADFWAFVRSDGKLNERPTAPTRAATLHDLFDKYFASQFGQKEENTLHTEGIHRRHLERKMGADKPVRSITTADVQAYITGRSKSVGPTTVKKEIATLRMLLYRASKLGIQAPVEDIKKMFAGLEYAKGKEKDSFMTWAEIEARVKRTTPGQKETKELWDRLFLSVDHIEEFLDWATEKKARHPVPFFVPLVTAAAHTGARVSELMRSRLEDWHWEDGTVVLREKKRSQKGDTLRRVNLSPRLTATMKAWFSEGHPGGQLAFCREPDVRLKGKNLRNVFDRFIGQAKWKVIRGYHVFRHSFASNLALAKVDERVVDELMGHQTEEMRKRYRHFFPEQRHDAVARLFGK